MPINTSLILQLAQSVCLFAAIVTCCRAIIRSVHRLMQEQRRAHDMQMQLAHRMDALGTLAGGVVHDINNALVPIIGTVDILLAGTPADSDTGEHLKDILSGAARIQDVTTRFLALNRQDGSR